MLKTREVVLINILFVIIAAGLYYVLFFMPTSAKISDAESEIARKESELNEAMIRGRQYAALEEQLLDVNAEWAEAAGPIPDGFDEADLMLKYQRIIFPHTREVSVTFPGGGAAQETTAVYPVKIEMTVTQEQLLKILADIDGEGPANRIVEYSFARIENVETGEARLRVNLQVEYLTRR